MSDEKKSWLDRAGAVHLWKTIEAMLGTKVDKIEGFGLSSNDYTTEEKKKLASLSDPDVATTENNGLMSSADKAKLDGIEAGANNYTHPEYEAKQAGLYRISVDNTGHVATADKMTSEELAAEGVSPADHTHDLGELVDTLETSADVVEDADTIMVGATVASGDGSSTMKYTRRPLAALWDWIKSMTDTLYAAAGHTHNYAGSTEPGGDALNAMKLKGYDVSSRSTGYQNVIPAVGDDGVIEVGKYVDFHTEDIGDNYKDYNIRMVAYDNGTLDVIKAAGQPATITANLNGTANFATETQFDKETQISATSLNQNTWYPVVSMNYIPYTGLHHIKCNIQLNSGTKPSWSTHNAGFTVNLDMLVMACGWGTTGAQSIVLDNSYQFVTSGSSSPVGYSQMNNSSKAVFWVRGGGSYRIHSDWDANWQLQTSTYTDSSQSVSPTTSYPGVNYNKATLDGGALSSYPVGSIYMSTSSTSPASLFGGSWQSIASERVLMGVSGSHGAGSTVDAGLPNISSGSDAALDIQGSWGAPACRAPFAQTWQGNSELSSSTWSSTPKVISARFDASLCNSIYGKSSTVQPAAYYVYMWRRTG